MILLACDSGLERTGFAIFQSENGNHTLLDYGCIFTDAALRTEQRFVQLHTHIAELIVKHNPDRCVLERLFFSKNVTTAIAVAQSQGVVMGLVAQHDIPVDFLTPQEIKMTMTGYGNADKKSVQKMVKLLLKLDSVPQPDDTADAIACGLTYCTMMATHDRKNNRLAY